jgi:phosphohistidine phosphatase
MIIYFLRHASAGQSKKDPAADEKRPLDKEGIDQCRYMGRTLAAINVQVDAVISSPLKRASQTASLVANEIGYEGKLQLHPALRPEATYEDFRGLLDENSKHEAILVVGHNPNLSRFLSLLISNGTTDTCVDMKKAAVAKVDVRGSSSGVLGWCIVPKMMRAIYETSASSSRPKTSRK